MPLIQPVLPILNTLLTTLRGPAPPHPKTFVVFFADIVDGKMWCPDCLLVEDIVNETFGPDDGPTGVIIRVGDKPTWKSPTNQWRDASPNGYNVQSIPTIIKLVNGNEVGRIELVEEVEEADGKKRKLNKDETRRKFREALDELVKDFV